MRVRVITQENRDTGEKNVSFTRDNDARTEDFMVAWPNSTVTVGEVEITGDNPSILALLEDEFRSVRNTDASDQIDILEAVGPFPASYQEELSRGLRKIALTALQVPESLLNAYPEGGGN